ncbi:MAG: hypothetical protein CYPHOPRED_002502 [Cyphobasidiales sp. Tagirdzhanova-0007]|nr:MAG: hypothetical protein CYPHOPRED_002502 [Cyphobasidiales sp. Tagirdzhanova-0007]
MPGHQGVKQDMAQAKVNGMREKVLKQDLAGARNKHDYKEEIDPSSADQSKPSQTGGQSGILE